MMNKIMLFSILDTFERSNESCQRGNMYGSSVTSVMIAGSKEMKHQLAVTMQVFQE